ncbi:TIP41-like protein [Vitis vinifera]|uniref:TIP41-like protein n=1 Tax=Vitis vinifera TaxID=29760 RepID=A0A438EPX2_VITVI|nr:TIP41-like protein [Vitis vinifera]
MEVEVDEKDLKAAGAEMLTDGRHGLRIHGWEIESRKRSILNSPNLQQFDFSISFSLYCLVSSTSTNIYTILMESTINLHDCVFRWEEKLQTSHLPEMVFGESSLVLKHVNSGIKIHFNAFDALTGWKQEALPPVEVPAAAKWKFRRSSVEAEFRAIGLVLKQNFEPLHVGYVSFFGQIILTDLRGLENQGVQPPPSPSRFQTSATQASLDKEKANREGKESQSGSSPHHLSDIHFLNCSKPFQQVILDYDYTFTTPYCGSQTLEIEQEKPLIQFFFQLRVDGVLMRLRDTRMHCILRMMQTPSFFGKAAGEKLHSKLYLQPLRPGSVINGWDSLWEKGYPSDSAHIMIQAPSARGFPSSCIRPKSLRWSNW